MHRKRLPSGSISSNKRSPYGSVLGGPLMHHIGLETDLADGSTPVLQLFALSLIPILWSEGRGAEVMRPMVLPVIGGMCADLISLFSVPVFYAWWWERKLARTAAPPAAPPAAADPAAV